MRKSLFTLLVILFGVVSHCAEKVYMGKQGVICQTENRKEVVPSGANYCLPSACDSRAAGYVGGDREQMIVEDLEHFRQMSWDGLCLCFWGGYQNTDHKGDLLENGHLHLLDYLIAEAGKWDIYVLFGPIVTYNSQ